MKTRILFVCHGNICRSPMAEFLMKDLVKGRGLEGQFEIASAATSREEMGNPVYPPVRELLSRRGISCKGKTARQILRSDYDAYDYIIGMDQWNRQNLLRFYGNDPAKKISLLLDWTGENRDVDDPWYTGGFSTAEADILRGCTALLDALTENNS